MSELFEALRKIEKNKNRRENRTFDIFGTTKRKPPYLLILSSILFVSFTVFCGLYFVRVYQIKKLSLHSAIQKYVIVNSVKNYNRRKAGVEQKRKTVVLSTIENTKLVKKQPHKSSVVAMVKTKNLASKITKNLHSTRNTVVKKYTKKGKSIVWLSKRAKRPRKPRNERRKTYITTAQLVQWANSGDFNQSIHAYELLLKRFPDNIVVYNNYAAKLMEGGFYKKASVVLERALKIEQNSDIKLNLAICYIKLGKLEKVKELIRTIKPNPKNEQILGQIRAYLSSMRR